MNSQLIKMEALLDGFEEGIALNIRGHVSEGSGENLFLVVDGTVLTPPLSSSVLPGITRDSVVKLFRDMGVRVVEETIPREMLYVADEVFFTGSAAEVTPIRSIDKIAIGNGKRGPLTEKVQTAFFEVIDGKRDDVHGWLTFV
jgi:branched-chain amino acid aminotransferase